VKSQLQAVAASDPQYPLFRNCQQPIEIGGVKPDYVELVVLVLPSQQFGAQQLFTQPAVKAS
jgi:hypothetical protein